MRREIIQSKTEPNKNNLWLSEEGLNKYGKNGWEPLGGGISPNTPIVESISGDELIPINQDGENKAVRADELIKGGKEVFIVTSDMFVETATVAGQPSTLTFTDEAWSDFIGAVEANKIIALDYTVSGTLIFQATPMAIIRPSTGYFILTGFNYDPNNVYANGFLSWLSQTGDSPAVYAITFSNKNVTSTVINTPSELYYLDVDNYSTAEDFNNLKEAIDNGKIIYCNIDLDKRYEVVIFSYSYTTGIVLDKPKIWNTVDGIVLEFTQITCKSDGTITQSKKQFIIDNTGDGTKCLSDDGTYKIIPTKVSELENDANYFSNKSIEDGVYIYTTDKEFIKPDDWDTTNNSKAVAIAIIDYRCSFGIPLSSSVFSAASFSHHIYGGKGIDIAEIPNCTTTEEALNDFNGYSHTQAIIQQSFASAAKIAYNHTFPNGEHGYLPAYGELYVFSLYKDAIADAANKVGKDYDYDDFEVMGHIISSTEHGANSYYGIIFGSYTNEYDDGLVNKDYDHSTDFMGSDYYNLVIPFLHIERPKELIQTDGDGTKFLSNDGSYKEVGPYIWDGTTSETIFNELVQCITNNRPILYFGQVVQPLFGDDDTQYLFIPKYMDIYIGVDANDTIFKVTKTDVSKEIGGAIIIRNTDRYSTNELQSNTYRNFGILTNNIIITYYVYNQLVSISEYQGEFSFGDTVYTVTFPNTVKWSTDSVLEYKANHTYQFRIVNGLGVMKEFANA